jgi:hypothetical protein
MGNNPVMYVDPDGEFVFLVVGAVIGAYVGGAMANDHMNPGKWDYSSGSTWAGMGVGAVVGAFGGHALGAAKGKAAATKTKVGTFIAKPVMKAGLKSGTMNTLSNYDYEGGWSDFGIGTLADFGAGFAGGAAAVGSG